jgi:hypothetical protein
MSWDDFPDLATLRSAVFRVIHGQIQSERPISRLISLIECLPGDLPAPYSHCADDFRDDFSPTAIAFILDSDGQQRTAALLNSVLDSYCALFLRVLTDGRYDTFLEAAVKMFDMSSHRIYSSAPLFGFWPTSTPSPFFLAKLELVCSSTILYDLRNYFGAG